LHYLSFFVTIGHTVLPAFIPGYIGYCRSDRGLTTQCVGLQLCRVYVYCSAIKYEVYSDHRLCSAVWSLLGRFECTAVGGDLLHRGDFIIRTTEDLSRREKDLHGDGEIFITGANIYHQYNVSPRKIYDRGDIILWHRLQMTAVESTSLSYSIQNFYSNRPIG